MKRGLIRAAVMLGICVATLLVATPAMAIWDWCDVDPVISIGGHTVSIDAAIQGDQQQIRGDIVFNVSVPRGTEVRIISIDPGARVKIKYDAVNCDDDHSGSSYHQSSPGIPVEVSVDINTKATFNSRLIVSIDGKQVAQDLGTTRHELECAFTIR